MTPNQQEEMEKDFKEWFSRELEKASSNKSLSGLIHYEMMEANEDALFVVFKAAYSLQQEKIEKLEKDLAQQKFNNAHNLSIDQQIADKIESLKSDLEWCFSKFRQMLPRMSESYGVGVEEGIREIRQRHCLDKSEEV